MTAELIARLERATGPDRELDNAIAAAVGFKVPTANSEGWPLHYTASIDAALTLFEPGTEYCISTLYGIAFVEAPLNHSDFAPERARRNDGNVPLAICEVALRARAVPEEWSRCD